MKKNIWFIVTVIFLVWLLGYIIYTNFIYDQESDNPVDDDFSLISECNEYVEGGCSYTFENVQLDDEIVDLKYKIYKDSGDYETIKMYLGFNRILWISAGGDIVLNDLNVMGDYLYVNVGNSEWQRVMMFNKYGEDMFDYDTSIAGKTIVNSYIEGDSLFIEATDLSDILYENYYDICSSTFYEESGYSSVDIGYFIYEYEIYDNVFLDKGIVLYKTLEQLIEENCN